MRWLAWHRLWAMLVKEFVQMRRDRVTFAMMLGVPLIQLVLFGFAINNDPKKLPAALVTTSEDQFTRAIVTALENTGYYRFTHILISAEKADLLIDNGTVSFVVTIPSDFARRVMTEERPQILIEADATDPSVASGAISTLSTVSANALRRELAATAGAGAVAGGGAALEAVVHRRYNPEGVTQFNIVPGLLGVILQMTMVMMTAMALTREVERGTMENLLALPATPLEIMLGKVLPFLVVGAGQVVVVLVAARVLFGVPMAGDMRLLLAGILIFVLALIFLGYTFSTLARTQMQAMQLSFFFFLPSILLSGFAFPFRGMPGWAQAIGEALPLTHFLRLVRGVMLKGADLHTVSSQIAALIGFAVLFAALALIRFRRTLD
ncbi:ABC-2 type transport system permease protein [Meinhardsimonia xiamenensis]|jgi:ABC-2 type transport system permease protein|uniref:ABC-2 type transport system permease protein n=1 Tax=Meinhardsimonia xiamenensis TaxID=990712 RepID=A0A1G9AQC6_9RHOB|nr:ABC transporter permease [Meinhardsimonia xiamenensis]PRX35286.1 ABC-2 type transport system permease protein [Meinhardsimonia xiamenensis]SDK29518.1 ABC-2 type transport system permease protein [Meinhardsimonia xiamenensis]